MLAHASSCVGRMKGCAGAYWANLLISSITQINGDSSGALFDTRNFQFLTTDAVIDQALQWMEKQVEFGMDGGTIRFPFLEKVLFCIRVTHYFYLKSRV